MADEAASASPRSWIYRQLVVGAGPDGRLTWTNRLLVAVILAAVASGALATEPSLSYAWQRRLLVLELVFGALFLAEYLARIYAAAEAPGPAPAWQKRLRFVFSPLGLIDLLVIASALLPLLTADAAVLRTIRLLRVLAVVKFGRFSRAIGEVWSAVTDRADDLIVTAALALVLLLLGATALYLAEGAVQPEQFGSIPRALWWSVNTLTTVGYGDAVPVTAAGKVFAAIIALSGIVFVAMPTGIFAAAFSDAMQRRRDQKVEDLRAHMARLEQADEAVEAKLAALERNRHLPHR